MLKITSITLYRDTYGGANKVFLHTDLPGGCWPYDEPARLTLEVAAGKGEEYCAANFPGIPVEVVRLTQ